MADRDPEATLFPELPGYGGLHAAQHWREVEQRRWDAQWERDHPPDRTCLFCGKPGGTLWLTTGGVGPRPCHRECAA